MSNRPDRRRTKHAPAVRVEAQHRVLRHRTASVQDRVVAPSRDEIRRSITNGECPFCGARYKNIAGHTYKAHGVGAEDLKDMAGIPKTSPVCTPELSSKLSEINKRDGKERSERMRSARDPHAKRQLSSAAYKAQRENAERGRAKQIAQASIHDDEIVARIRAGDLVKVIADDLGTTRSSVKRALRRKGFTEDLRKTNSGYGRR